MKKSLVFFIIGILLVLALIITIVLYKQNKQKPSDSIVDEWTLSTLSQEEIAANFNSQFESYNGKQTGSQIVSLCGRLITNASSNSTGRDNPDVKIDKLNAGDSAGVEANIYTEYINKLTKIINNIDNEHIFYVEFEYCSSSGYDYGFLKKIIIHYDVPEKTTQKAATNDKSRSTKKNATEFNDQFESYSGRQTGKTIVSLCGTLIVNADTYKKQPKKVPYVKIDKLNAGDSKGLEAKFDSEGDFQSYTRQLTKIIDKIENERIFYVEFQYSLNNFLEKIIIYYKVPEKMNKETEKPLAKVPMSTTGIDAFNNQYEAFKKSQKGSQISELCERLIANSNYFKENPGNVPDVECKKINANMTKEIETFYYAADSDILQEYKDALGTIKDNIEEEHTYYVEFQYDPNGFIIKIIINYELPEGVNTKDVSLELPGEEEIEFNDKFISYQGEKTGAEVYELMNALKANCNTHESEPEKVLEIDYGLANSTERYEVTATYNSLEDKASYLEKIVEIKNLLEDDHTYMVSLEYTEEIIGKIIIGY